MSDTQIAAQQLAQAIARLRRAERLAGESIARISFAFAVVRTRFQIQL